MGKVPLVRKALNKTFGIGLQALNVNSGLGKRHTNKGYSFKYGDRLVELPFLFSNILDPPKKILDIGSVESIHPIQLSMLGYKVTGIDIRNYNFSHPNFKFIKNDLLKYNFNEKFDIAINISAIEHFGLGYGDSKNERKDIEAVNKIYEILNKNGQFIFTAPYGKHKTIVDFERIYAWNDILSLLDNKFSVRTIKFFKLVAGKKIFQIKKEEADEIDHDEKNSTYALVCLDLRKNNKILPYRTKLNQK